jgi:hypothetical protein
MIGSFNDRSAHLTLLGAPAPLPGPLCVLPRCLPLFAHAYLHGPDLGSSC